MHKQSQNTLHTKGAQLSPNVVIQTDNTTALLRKGALSLGIINISIAKPVHWRIAHLIVRRVIQIWLQNSQYPTVKTPCTVIQLGLLVPTRTNTIDSTLSVDIVSCATAWQHGPFRPRPPLSHLCSNPRHTPHQRALASPSSMSCSLHPRPASRISHCDRWEDSMCVKAPTKQRSTLGLHVRFPNWVRSINLKIYLLKLHTDSADKWCGRGWD